MLPPPLVGEGLRERGLTTTYCDYNFQPIPIRQLLRGKRAARYDLAVALQSDALAGQAHLFDESGNVGGIGKLTRCAVDADGNHFQSVILLR